MSVIISNLMRALETERQRKASFRHSSDIASVVKRNSKLHSPLDYYRQRFSNFIKIFSLQASIDLSFGLSGLTSERLINKLSQTSIDKAGSLSALKNCCINDDIIAEINGKLASFLKDQCRYEENKTKLDNLMSWQALFVRNRVLVRMKIESNVRRVFRERLLNQTSSSLFATLATNLQEDAHNKMKKFSKFYLPQTSQKSFDELFEMWMKGEAFLLADDVDNLRIVPDLDLAKHYEKSLKRKSSFKRSISVPVDAKGRLSREEYSLKERDPFFYYKFIPETNAIAAKGLVKDLLEQNFIINEDHLAVANDEAIFQGGDKLVERLVYQDCHNTLSSVINKL